MKKIMFLMIRIYQAAISSFLPPACRFSPTCSSYSMEAIGKYGAAKGSWLALKRLLKCHPFHPGGFDPVD